MPTISSACERSSGVKSIRSASRIPWISNGAGFVGNGCVATVFSPVSPNPTNITTSVTGTDLTLSWPESHKGWTLQTQTNSRSVGLTTNGWFDVSGSDATNSVTVPLNKVDPTVFYRLRLPQP